MRWSAVVLVWCLTMAGAGFAQEARDERAGNWLTVLVDSAFIRTLPGRDSEVAASRFEGDRLEAVGRNADGTWFQVTAPYDETPLGWIAVDLISFDFEITLLPLTDTVTGVTGPTPVADTGVAVNITINARLRNEAARTGAVLEIIPNGVTVPVLARNPAGDWLQVNYNGQVGWVALFLTHTVNDLQTLPVVTPGIGGSRSFAPVRVIPPEVQIAQINRLRFFIASLLEASNQLSSQISGAANGEIVPCVPLSSAFSHFRYSAEDVRQLPELGRYGPSLNRAIDDLNTAIALIGQCGVYTEATLAKATALLPAGFLNGVLYTLDNLEEEIVGS